MKQITRIILSLYICLAVYTGAEFLWGPSGYLENKKLVLHKEELSGNIEQLTRINNDLNTTFNQLYSDSDSIRLHSRELGYFASNEGVIRLTGYSPSSHSLSMGKMLRLSEADPVDMSYYRIIAILIAFCFYFGLGFLLKNREENR